MGIMDVQLTVSQQMKLRRLIDWAYEQFIEMASPTKMVRPQHEFTTVDMEALSLALVELAALRKGQAPSGKHIQGILEMLWDYGVTEAQQELPLDT